MQKNLSDFVRELKAEESENIHGPSPDIAICTDCGGRFGLDEFKLEWEFDGWEYPEYQVAVCPVCEDGGCLDTWDFSPEQLEKYKKWEAKK